MSWFDRIFRRAKLRREAILREAFPEGWLATLRRCVACYPALTKDEQQTLRQMVQFFVAEKEFLGIGSLAITDEIKVTVAGQACLLLVGIPGYDVFPRLREVIVRPHDFGETIETVGPDGRRYRIQDLYAGQAWRGGPVILAWNSVEHSIARAGDGFNVVYHEFAHVLDMQLGIRHGAPPLETREQRDEWTRVFNAEFKTFVEATRRGQRTFIDPYGAESQAEFFAVITEHFFEQPQEMKTRHPDLYAQLRLFYRQDPEGWWGSGTWAARTGRWG
jgi:MtfA peptidase